jgi:hypothetical protein
MVICDKLSEIIIKEFCFEKYRKVLVYSNISFCYAAVIICFY